MRFKANLRTLRSAVVLFLLVLASVMTGCHDDTAHLNIIGDTFYYNPDKLFDYESYFAELEAQARPETEVPAEITVSPETEAHPVVTEPAVTHEATDTVTEAVQTAVIPEADTVYWVNSGEVWHTSAKCPSLSRSKTVLSGTVEAAVASGKARVCKRCGN